MLASQLTQDQLTFLQVKKYLIEKGVRFMVKTANETISIFGVKVTHDGRNYRANGKIISSQFAKELI